MTSNDVATVMAQALTRANDFLVQGATTNGVVAVVDREGFVLGVWSLAPNPSALDVIDAITKAGTAAFLSSDQQALSSRTAGFIVQQHFPPGIKNRPTGPLVGVNFSNLSFSDVNRFKNPDTYDGSVFGGGGTNGAPITPLGLAALSGLAGSPGGVPLYKDGILIGGVGAAITGSGPIPELFDIQMAAKQRADIDEDVALAGQIGFATDKKFFGSRVLIDGIRVPYVDSKTTLNSVAPLGSIGSFVAPYEITNSPPVNYPAANLGGTPGEIRAPIIDDPLPGTIDGEARLTARGHSSAARTISASVHHRGEQSKLQQHHAGRARNLPHQRSDDIQLGRRCSESAHGFVFLQSARGRGFAACIAEQSAFSTHDWVPRAKFVSARHSKETARSVAGLAGVLFAATSRSDEHFERC
jgi:uncharacterized protein GlcG (DUF336 family)